MKNSHQESTPKQYKGWLVSNSFLKRAFAVWGHMLFAYMFTVIVISVFVMLLGLIIGLFL